MNGKQKTPRPQGRQIGALAGKAASPWSKGPNCRTPNARRTFALRRQEGDA